MAVPKLRFKEFDGDWTSKQLGKIIGISSASRVFKEQWQDSGVPFFRTSDVVSLFKNKENEKAYISLELFEELAKKSGKIKQGDLLVTGGGSIGIPYLVPNDQPLYFKDADLLWMKSSGIVEGSFLYNFFISPKFREYLKSISHTGTISHFTIEQAKATPFGFPSKEEQTKIASFLSNVDEKISQLTQKHELLSQYKQGMMQKLFSQQIRFKADDGSEFGEWEEVKFSDIFNFHQTNSYSRALLAEYGEIMNIHYGDIHTKFSMLFDVNKESVPFLNDEVDTSKIAKEQFLKVGDLVIADASEDYKDIGKSIEVISLNNQKVVAGLHTYIARPVKPFALGFCGYMMQTFPVREQIKKLATGISVLGISKTNLGKVELKVPCLEEQTKIANFLSAIDQKIEVVAQQIEQAKTWKKGLLQQMFV